MTITVMFFANIREQVGQDSLTLTGEFASVSALRQHLVAKGEPWASALGQPTLLAAVNHEIVPLSTAVSSQDEVAFFPPVTGG
ncbi:molybdopterin synthase sulfur carrier subunit [Oceanisphaera pacifica]|uniref:Molybdopterin synthase sulfur carrier subunit n=1 Tax=Oceanisphaera pacifica TaxID=2818389 RepID=A0ABS3NF75_9GAMM|nr:molybdopterin synthase sulfur carrier subunit [Oceanisphaera pacifica]MBO1519033.1 molybdopterin synthase sulfur carrier subunit [Oceanisphaera pacifica]